MSMSSTRYAPPPSRSSRTPSTPAARPPSTPIAKQPHMPSSVAQSRPPLMSPHHAHTALATSGVRSPSPNYFGFQVADTSFSSETQHNTRSHWSPPSSAVRSAAAFSPTVIPVDQNPDFAAFRRQSEGAGRTFSLGNLDFTKSSPVPPKRDTPSIIGGRSRNGSLKYSEPTAMGPPSRPSLNCLDPDFANLGRSPKRHLSSDSTNCPEPARKASPASFLSNDSTDGSSDAVLSPDRHMRNSLPPTNHPIPSLQKHRAETLPASTSQDSPLITPQHAVTLFETASEDILILDLRVSTQYGQSHISCALNLCIPTTLIKRPSFNVQKLAETFKNSEQRLKFENWRSSKYIIVYDAAASQMKDAQICINTIQKFEKEGYEGTSYIIKGGFADFARCFPSYVNKGLSLSSSNTGSPRLVLPGKGSDSIPPVIGGCPMPAAKSAANPFFGNIRQNMDLIGGVGQMPVKRPESVSDPADLPRWLKAASEPNDNGAKVSDKFLQIEKREQKRMQDALSGSVSYGTPSEEGPKTVKIAGIEKGSKNRYNNIWPFEHTRVKLEGVPNHGCDYFNANHIASSLSNKRYIATQGPIPTTFADFWNVVWQQDVRVIVMLTAEKEGGQVKAHDYWSGNRYGPFALDLLSERKASLEPAKIHRHRSRPKAGSRRSSARTSGLVRKDSTKEASSLSRDEPYVTVRRLTLAHEGHPFQRMREITQLQYSSWPDFGAPAHPAHLLGLVEQVDAVVSSTNGVRHHEPEPPNSRPVLVHCSAGCGRTGTFCTVDTVIDMLKRQRTARFTRQSSPMDLDSGKAHDESPFFSTPSLGIPSSKQTIDGDWVNKEDQDLVERTVDEFRVQRLSMVQSLRQFVLCYESVMEWLSNEDRLDQEDSP